jgi:DNA mismatch repair protein MutS
MSTVTLPLPTKTTPMMTQWHSCKQLAKNAVLLFRMGDFYEAFYDDAETLSRELGLTLTKRQGIPMSGVPHHTCQSYIDKLISKGIRVAIAEQMENPKEAKGLVRREVTRIVTPGTLVDSTLLSEKGNNFFLCIEQVGKTFGLACIDVSTSTFKVLETYSEKELLNEIYRIRPKELLSSIKFHKKNTLLCSTIERDLEAPFQQTENWRFEHQEAYHVLIEQFNVKSLDGFGLKGATSAINAAGALLNYLKEELLLPIDQINCMNSYSSDKYMSLDHTSLNNLELIYSSKSKNKKNTLLEVLDHTQTAMGGRLLTFWISHPLVNIDQINQRQESITDFLKTPVETEQLRSMLFTIKDLERLTMRISSGYATPRDLACLRESLHHLPEVKKRLNAYQASMIVKNKTEIVDISPLQHILEKALLPLPPIRVSDGNIFKKGYNSKLDQLHSLSKNNKAWLANYQQKLRDELEAKSLKVSFSKAFGYYIEVSKGQAHLIPDTFQRRQTLVNNERFISSELKTYETQILTAEEQIATLELQLFQSLKEEIVKYHKDLQQIAGAIAKLDCILSLTYVARTFNYTRPLIDQSNQLQINSGRHPIIESISLTEPFIPNDTEMDGDENRLLLITGPNMAGKSTYIRQVALLVIMAQIGSFIPAKSAHIGIIDKVFTRVGASDDLSRGQSTFMVEMSETANILNHVTSKSLVILDEIGRGTSTYDGISIAWAIAEYLLTTEGKQAKTLFATHYWELTKLEGQLKGAVNYNVAVQETNDTILFLRKIIRGDTDKSYGIHVARLAGVPLEAIERAKEILIHLEENANRKNVFASDSKKIISPSKIKRSESEAQLLLFPPTKNDEKKIEELLKKINSLSINELTPLQAQNELAQILKLTESL